MCRPGHRPSEHIYVLKSVFIKHQAQKKPLIAACFDLRKMFDSEDLYDCLNQVYLSEVTGKLYRLLFQMNKNVRLTIQTPVGDTPSANTGPIVTQGGVDGAVMSSVSIGNDVSDAFKEKEDEYEVKYENVQLSPLLFLDDILRCSDTVESANYVNKLLEKVISKKGLEFNSEKSMFIVMGNKKA